MLLTATALMIIIAFGCSIAALNSKMNPAVPVLLLSIAELLHILPK
jgi:hypothetical protein